MQQCRHWACPESKHHCNKKTAHGCLGGDDDQRVPVPSCCTKTNTRVLCPQSHQSLPQSSSQDFLTFPLSAALFLHILSNRFFFTFSATAVSSLSQQQQQKLCFSSSADDRSSADFLRSECCFILEDLDPEPNALDHIPCNFVLFTSWPILALAHRFSQHFRLPTDDSPCGLLASPTLVTSKQEAFLPSFRQKRTLQTSSESTIAHAENYEKNPKEFKQAWSSIIMSAHGFSTGAKQQSYTMMQFFVSRVQTSYLYNNQSGRRNNSNKDLSFRIPRCCCCCSPSPPPLGTPHDMAMEWIVLFVVVVVPTVDRSTLARYVLF